MLDVFVAGEDLSRSSQQSEAERLYAQFLHERNSDQISTANFKIWIERFETVLPKSNIADPTHYHILFSLAELYDSIKEKDISEVFYSQVFHSDKAPFLLRAVAGENILSLNRMKMVSSRFNLAEFLQEFDYIINLLNKNDRVSFLTSIQRNRLLWADSILEDRRKTLNQLLKENLHQDAFVLMRDTYIQIKDMLLKSVTEYSLLNNEQKNSLMHLNFGIDNTLFHIGSAEYELGLLYTNNNEKDKGKAHFDSAQEVLLDLLKEYGRESLFASKSVVLTLKIQGFRYGTGNDEFLPYVKKMYLYVQHHNDKLIIHTIQNYLMDCAGTLSKDGTREIAVKLYDFIIAQEEKIFPHEYKNNLNYQLALTFKASNCAEIGNADEMQKSIEKLESCEIIDGETEKFITGIVEHSNERITDTLVPVFDSNKYELWRIVLIFLSVILIITSIIMMIMKRAK
jgi:hypothetical protein